MGRAKPKQTFLYFFSAPGRIKIGIARDVERRRRDVGNHMDELPEIIGHIPGSFHLEKHIHGMLSAHRLKGEWFADCDTVRLTIQQLLERGPSSFGFKEPPPKAKFVPGPPMTRDQKIERDIKILHLLWPLDGLRQFAFFVERPESEIKDIFEGKLEWTRPLRFIFASLVSYSALSDKPMPDFLAGESFEE